jgi:ABC-type uncharacterized transport system permease subunit
VSSVVCVRTPLGFREIHTDSHLSIYLLFEAFPIVFSEGHGFNAGLTGLMFLGVFMSVHLECRPYSPCLTFATV